MMVGGGGVGNLNKTGDLFKRAEKSLEATGTTQEPDWGNLESWRRGETGKGCCKRQERCSSGCDSDNDA